MNAVYKPDPDEDRLQLRSDPASIQNAVSHIEKTMGDFTDDADAVASAVIASAEALNNIVEHAYLGATDGSIGVETRRTGSDFLVILTDSGAPLVNPERLVARLPDLGRTRDELPEGGFGLYMIQTLSSKIDRSRRNGINRLEMTFPLASAES